MRVIGILFAAVAIALPAQAAAQGWIEYTNRDDRFSINFPGEPQIEEIQYQPLEGPEVPARIYSATQGENEFRLTVVDFSQEYELTTWPFAYTGANAVQGATAFAATELRQRGEVTYDAYDRLNLIPGQLLQITEPSGRRIFAGIYTYDRRLYIMEASVPEGAPPPAIFRTSLAILDTEGERIRFDQEGNFTDGLPPPELRGDD
jgi:hypothetical protein